MEILKNIADNPALLEALRKTLEKQFSLDNIDTSLTNDQMGEVVRARVDGLKMLDLAFKEIKRFKSVETKPAKINEAR